MTLSMEQSIELLPTDVGPIFESIVLGEIYVSIWTWSNKIHPLIFRVEIDRLEGDPWLEDGDHRRGEEIECVCFKDYDAAMSHVVRFITNAHKSAPSLAP